MARVNIYLPDDLAERARATGLNVSGLAQQAIRRVLDTHALNAWLDRVAKLESDGIDPQIVKDAVTAAKDEFELGE